MGTSLCSCSAEATEVGATTIFTRTEAQRAKYGGPWWVNPDGTQQAITKIGYTTGNDIVLEFDQDTTMLVSQKF